MTDRDTLSARIVRRAQNPDLPSAELVWVECPFCGETHRHGLPDGLATRFPELRVPHCGRRAGYYIVENETPDLDMDP